MTDGRSDLSHESHSDRFESGISGGPANEFPAQALIAVSDKPSLIPAPQVNYVVLATDGELVLKPVSGQTGEATITVTLVDGGGLANGGKDTTVMRFKVTVPDDGSGAGPLAPLYFQHADGSMARWLMRAERFRSAEYFDPVKPDAGNWRVQAVADFDQDGSLDVLLEEESGTMAVWFMEGTRLKGGAVLNPSRTGDSNWRVVAAGDLNGDGQPDLVFQHTDGTLAAWLMNGVTLTEGLLLNPPTPGDKGWSVMGAGDFNGDGRTDLVFQHTDGTLAVWLMNGSNLSEGELIDPAKAPTNASVLAVTDLDRDGKTDLIFQDSQGLMRVWFMDGTKQRSDDPFNPSTASPGWSIVGP